MLSMLFMYEMSTFSLSILKENFDLVEVAHTGKSSLPVTNNDSPFPPALFPPVPVSWVYWSPVQAMGNCHFDASYWISPSCTKAATTTTSGSQLLLVT